MDDLTAVTDLDDRDERIFRLRLLGKSTRSIARLFKIPVKEVDKIVASYCTVIDAKEKAQAYQLDLHRIDEMQAAAYPAALQGNVSAIAAVTKLLERRASMLGHDAPQRHDPIQVLAVNTAPNSTERIQAMLDEISGVRAITDETALAPANGDDDSDDDPDDPA